MLFELPGYQFPYTVMNRCLYLRQKIHSTIVSVMLIESSVKFMKEGQNRGFHPSFEKLPIKDSSISRVLEPILEVERNLWDLLFQPLKYLRDY
jgi:hypothetical protein